MRTLQYCYFALKSTTMSAKDITNRLLMQPDEVMVMGSRHPEHRVPRCHAWKIVRRSTESVDDQIQHLVDRLSPVHPRLVTLVTDPDVSPVMEVVRYFHHEEGVQAPPDGSLPMLGQPRPLGWSLSPLILQFLSSTRTTLDVDEYDLSDENDENPATSPSVAG
ncbi:DUF4279 domain-containing protein [Kibdelosporangium philippinense]|uniref:DUF4279 domain-containing protein n=2 Tax=Kibdelosporangium philippinense TaxID=211113 RepID=A0ABS8ZPE4_9PSEU|nr:DUF4279 domain-containing protein [Kibdelosporangium philippinense]MCE7009590.1 DUF4279 domain-containing protein [Kibdelosporangium philippinense]